MGLKAFVDFDRTITRHDVGNALFRTFGGPCCETMARAYRDGTITAVERLRAEAAAVGQVSRKALLAFIDDQPIEAEFPDFVRFCRERVIELTVVSDGLDLYIGRILAAHDLPDLAVVANHARLVGEGDTVRLLLEFPRTNAECPRCACCRRNVLLSNTGDDDVVMYVGVDYSEGCPARYADVVFARGGLQTFCQQENISYTLYRTFDDVAAHLNALLQRRRLHKRTVAEHLRRAAFAAE
jgi:2-hydroxy-3-keto-5-methylthiopentenyl-1-phosphate phosphatase